MARLARRRNRSNLMVVRISPTKRNAAIRLKFGFLPQEIVKRIAPCVDFSDHLVEVGA